MWVPGHDLNKAVHKSATRPRPTETSAVSMPATATPATDTLAQPKGKLAAAVAYITFIPAVIFVLIEPFKRNRFVRFHSFQSIFFAIATVPVAIALRVLYSLLILIPVVGYLLAWLAMAVALLGWVILWLVLLIKAAQGQTFRLTWIGRLAERA